MFDREEGEERGQNGKERKKVGREKNRRREKDGDDDAEKEK